MSAAIGNTLGEGSFGRTNEGVHRSQTAGAGHIVQGDARHADGRIAVPKVQESTGRAHGTKGRAGDHVHLLQSCFFALFFDHGHQFFSGHDLDGTGLDFFVDFFKCTSQGDISPDWIWVYYSNVAVFSQ